MHKIKKYTQTVWFGLFFVFLTKVGKVDPNQASHTRTPADLDKGKRVS